MKNRFYAFLILLTGFATSNLGAQTIALNSTQRKDTSKDFHLQKASELKKNYRSIC